MWQILRLWGAIGRSGRGGGDQQVEDSHVDEPVAAPREFLLDRLHGRLLIMDLDGRGGAGTPPGVPDRYNRGRLAVVDSLKIAVTSGRLQEVVVLVGAGCPVPGLGCCFRFVCTIAPCPCASAPYA